MATTMTYINKSLVDERVVSALRYVLPMFNSFSMRFEKEGMIKDDKVYVPVATDPSAGTKTLGTMVTAAGTLAGTAVTLDTPIGAGWDAIEGQIAPPLFENYWADKAAGAVYSVAKAVVDAALALVTSGNYGNTAGTDKVTVAPGDFGQADLASLWHAAENKKLGRQRSFGMNPAYAAALLGESNLGLIFANTGTNFVQTGLVPNLMGMSSWCYGAFPSNSQNLGGAIFDKTAIGAAVAPVAELAGAGQGNIGDRYIITEPNSGLSALYTQKIDAGGTISGEIAVLYGVAKIQDAIVRLVSA